MATDSKAYFLKTLDKQQRIINSLCAIYYHKEEDQQDTRQDIILQLWKSWNSFREDSAVSTWVYRVSLNTILNKKRMEQRRPELSPLTGSEELLAQKVIYSDDDLALLKQMINMLGDIEKAVVVLYLEGYQNKEIAEMLTLSVSNVSTRLHRVKNKMKDHYKKSSYALR